MDEHPNRLPPQDVDIESGLLAACLLGEHEGVIDNIKPEWFYRGAHQKIMSAIIHLANKNLECDIVSVASRLQELKQLEEVGGASYLAQLTDFPMSLNIEDHCKKINQYFQLRGIIHKSNEITMKAFEFSSEPSELIDDIQTTVNTIVVSRDSSGKRINEILPSVCDSIDKRIDDKRSITGVDTGFTGLNYYTAGLQPSDYIVLAARPSMGKTSFALNLVRNASKVNVWSDFYSLEMSEDQLVKRLIAIEGEIEYGHLMSGYLTREELFRYPDAAAVVNEMWIVINDNGDFTIGDIRRRARKNKKKYGTGIVVIDYLQLIKKEKANTNDAVSDISREIKMMAKELNVPVVALSQLNRKLEERGNKVPTLADLRDSGAVEQDADIVLFPFRPAVYVEQYEADGKTETREYSEKKDKAYLYISKHRNGPIGCTALEWDGRYSTFKNQGG